MTRAGILSGGVLAFIALAVACVVQQHGRLGRAEAARLPDRPPQATAGAAPTTQPPATALAPMLRAEFDGTTLMLTGRVPDTGLRDTIVDHARRVYGASDVKDRIDVVPTAPAVWLNGVFPPDLRETRRATALLQDGRLLVTGETGTDLARSRIEATLRAMAVSTWQLDLRLNTGDVDVVDADNGTPSRPVVPATTLRATAAKP